MEITTTMVRFRYFKEAMQKRTEKAQLILCGSRQNPEKVWVPLSKIEVTDYDEDPNYNMVVMPRWLFQKTVLPLYTDPEEFQITSSVDEKQLNK